jgi:hypothetical protein
MWGNRSGPEEPVTRERLDRLKAAINRIARSKHPSSGPLVCSVCHNLISLETMGMICADENGQTVHADCYSQRVIANIKTSAPPENQVLKSINTPIDR